MLTRVKLQDVEFSATFSSGRGSSLRTPAFKLHSGFVPAQYSLLATSQNICSSISSPPPGQLLTISTADESLSRQLSDSCMSISSGPPCSTTLQTTTWISSLSRNGL